MKVKFVVDFMDWKKGDIADLPKDLAGRYADKMKVAKVHKPAAKRSRSPKNRMATAPINKQSITPDQPGNWRKKNA